MANSKSASPYLWGVFILAIAALCSVAGWGNIYVLVIAVFSLHIMRMADADNIFQMSFLCGHFAFLAFPLMLHGIYDNNYIGAYSAILCSAGMLLVLRFSDRNPDYVGASVPSLSLKAFTGIFVAYMAVLIATGGASYLFTITFLPVAFHILALSTTRKSVVALAYAMGVIAVGVYYFQYSSGYGRLTMAAPLFVMTMVLLSWLKLPFRKPLLLGGVVIGAAVGSMVRSVLSFNFKSVADASLTASTSSPLVQLDEIVSTYHPGYGLRIGEWFDQVALFFLVPIPREIWPTKPEGFNFLYTVENLGNALMRAGHSIAALYPGEHVYYLGPVWGVFGSAFAIMLMCGLWHVLCRTWGGYLAAGVVVFIPSFYWGGLQAYSIRALMWLGPAILFAAVFMRNDGSFRLRRRGMGQVNSGIAVA